MGQLYIKSIEITNDSHIRPVKRIAKKMVSFYDVLQHIAKDIEIALHFE
jgi:hypothetical protein